MLDYTSGEAQFTDDQPPGDFSNNNLDEAQDVVEYWGTIWAQNGEIVDPPHKAGTGLGLDAAWYRDILRAKLVSIRLPKRLLVEYLEHSLAQRRALGIPLEE